jgi:hypothetical protein
VRGDEGRGMIVRAAVALSYGRGGDAGADAAEGAAGGPAGEPGNPTLPIDCTMPSLRQAHMNFREQYALPLSVCMITPRASPPRVVSSHGSCASLRAVPGRPLGDPCASAVVSVRWCAPPGGCGTGVGCHSTHRSRKRPRTRSPRPDGSPPWG